MFKGDGYDKWELMEEVKNQTEMGKLHVRVTMSYLRWLGHGMEDYKPMHEEEITQDMIDIALARLQTMPENMKIMVLGG